jgi:hypothetical protein
MIQMQDSLSHICAAQAPSAPTTTTRTKQENGNSPVEQTDVPKQFGVSSLEYARELAELTDRIVANLAVIDENDDDLEALLEQTNDNPGVHACGDGGRCSGRGRTRSTLGQGILCPRFA